MGACVIRPIRYVDVLGAPNAEALLSGYAAECSIPLIGIPNPQADVYAALESKGLMQCLGAFEGETLIGFVSILSAVNLHYGVKLAMTESLYVDPAHRAGGTGLALLTAAEDYATEHGCEAIQYSAPVGSSFERVLQRRADCTRTNALFTRRLA